MASTTLSAVGVLCGTLAGRSGDIEDAGRLPADIVGPLRDTGVFGMWLAAELGGQEARPSEVIAVLTALAEADASVGWCAAIGLASNLISGYLPRDGAEEVYATGREIVGGSLMPTGRATRTGPDELTVTGRWAFASGAHHSDYLAVAAILTDTNTPRPLLVVMPRSEVQLLDTWHVLGLKGTGSTDIQADAVRVPTRHSTPADDLTPWPAGTMWRIPLHSLLLPIMATVPLGIARAALTELTTLAGTKTPFRSQRTLAERDSTQATLAHATAGVDAAAGYLTATMTALFDTAREGTPPTLTQRATARLAAVHATHVAADAVQDAYRTAGTTALHLTNPLQRHLRDVSTCTQHYALSPNGYETTGKVLLGLPPDGPL